MTYRALLILIVYILLPFVQGASLSFHLTRGACTERQISPGTYSIIIRDMAGVEWNIIGHKIEPKQKINIIRSILTAHCLKYNLLSIETIIHFLIQNIIIPVAVASRYTKLVVVVDYNCLYEGCA